MDNMNSDLEQMNYAQANHMNMEQNSSFMRYLEQAAIQPPSFPASENVTSEMEKAAGIQQMQEMTSPNTFYRQPGQSILSQIPNIQKTVVPLEERIPLPISEPTEEKQVKQKIRFPKIVIPEIKKVKTKKDPPKEEENNLLDTRKFAEKVHPETIDVLEWITMYFIAAIPIVNFVVLTMWSLGKTNKKEKINWARANLIITIAMYLFIGCSIYITLWDIIKVYLP